jgi:hypothetical protein
MGHRTSDPVSKTGVNFHDLAVDPPSRTVLTARSGMRDADSIGTAPGVERAGFRAAWPASTARWAGIDQARIAIDAVFADGFE